MTYEVINRDGYTLFATNDFTEAFSFFLEHEDCGAYAILEDGKPMGW